MRLTRYKPQQLSAEQRLLYDEIAGGRRSQGRQRFPLVGDDGALEGPFNSMLLAPKLGFALQALGSAIRYGANLSPRVREVSILMVASKWNCEFEQRAHEPLAFDCGISTAEIEGIRSGRSPVGQTPAEQAAFEVSRCLINDTDLADDEFERYSTLLGADAIFELSTLVGYYSTLALQLRIFRV